MAINPSGQVSLGGTTSGESIALELGLPTTSAISLNQADVRGLAGVASGAIVMPTDFWGKASEFIFSFTPGTNQSLSTLATAAGWDGVTKLVATANAGTISATSTGSYAFSIIGTYPGGVNFINNATIIGRGGNGGAGGPNGNVGGAGLSAGPALLVSSAVTIQNNGSIRGGGGGGGGGRGTVSYNRGTRFASGGGGGGGIGVSSGGPGGVSSVGAAYTPGAPGGAGTLVAAGPIRSTPTTIPSALTILG